MAYDLDDLAVGLFGLKDLAKRCWVGGSRLATFLVGAGVTGEFVG